MDERWAFRDVFLPVVISELVCTRIMGGANQKATIFHSIPFCRIIFHHGIACCGHTVTSSIQNLGTGLEP